MGQRDGFGAIGHLVGMLIHEAVNASGEGIQCLADRRGQVGDGVLCLLRDTEQVLAEVLFQPIFAFPFRHVTHRDAVVAQNRRQPVLRLRIALREQRLWQCLGENVGDAKSVADNRRAHCCHPC